ncbi:hypothetical protein GCM10022393_10230 [Aquimarina addita]|uniref:Tetratricopeptide repeat protein n=2 Tax=Aquimarina addita TaxID=870485 RepID=A0ABP7XD19_9FLAO
MLVLGQKPKQKIFYSYSWNFPTVLTSQSKLGILIDETLVPITVMSEGVSNGIDGQYAEMFTKIEIASNTFMEQLDIRSFEIVPIEQAEIRLNIIPKPGLFKIYAEEFNSGTPTSPIKAFSGNIQYSYGVEIKIENAENEIVFEKKITKKSNLLKIERYNKALIPSANQALSLAKQAFLSSPTNYVQSGNGEFKTMLYDDVIEEIHQALDVRYEREKFYLYSFNKKKGFELEGIAASIEELEVINDWKESEDYEQKLREILLPKIEFWTQESAKYNPQDKKGKKVYWGLMANISGAYYALGEFQKALDIYEKLSVVSYRNDYLYLKEFPEDKSINKKNYIAKDQNFYKNYKKIDFRGNHNPDFIAYVDRNENGEKIEKQQKTTEELEIINKKIKVISQIITLDYYFKLLAGSIQKFTDENKEGVGFVEKDAFYVELINRVFEETEKLKVTDISFYDMDEKILVTETIEALVERAEPLQRELAIEDAAADLSTKNTFELLDMLIVSVSKNIDTETQLVAILEKNIPLLTKKIFRLYPDGVARLCYMEMLVDELTTGGKLTYADNTKLYKHVFKEFKRTYTSLSSYKQSLTRYLHHSDEYKLDKFLKVYASMYFEDVENINTKFKNSHDEKRVLDILNLFIK